MTRLDSDPKLLQGENQTSVTLHWVSVRVAMLRRVPFTFSMENLNQQFHPYPRKHVILMLTTVRYAVSAVFVHETCVRNTAEFLQNALILNTPGSILHQLLARVVPGTSGKQETISHSQDTCN